MTKPLPLFYAAEALTKAICVLSDAALEGESFRAHGLRGDKARRYVIRTLRCRTAPPGSDVWSRLLTLANFDLYTFEEVVDGAGQVGTLAGNFGVPPAPETELSLGDLLRHVPELAEDLTSAGWAHPYVVHARNLVARRNTGVPGGPPARVTIELVLRHAHNPATRDMIMAHVAPRGFLRNYTQRRDVLDILDYFANGSGPDEVSLPPMRLDIFGDTYMDFCRERAWLAELPIYYAALFILSDVVRYQGQWHRLLNDHPEEEVLIDRFLDIAIRKLPNLALNHLAGEVYLFKIGR